MVVHSGPDKIIERGKRDISESNGKAGAPAKIKKPLIKIPIK